MSGVRWTKEERTILKKFWSNTDTENICSVLPRHSLGGIRAQAFKRGYKRLRPQRMYENTHPVFAALRARRFELGLQQAAVADKIGIERTSFSAYEAGKRSMSWFMFDCWVKAVKAKVVIMAI